MTSVFVLQERHNHHTRGEDRTVASQKDGSHLVSTAGSKRAQDAAGHAGVVACRLGRLAFLGQARPNVVLEAAFFSGARGRPVCGLAFSGAAERLAHRHA